MNIHQEIKKIVQWQRINGCGNHGCLYKKVVGQGTNSSCSCDMSIANQVIDFVIKNKAAFLDQVEFIERS